MLLLPVGPDGGAQQFVRITRDAQDPTVYSERAHHSAPLMTIPMTALMTTHERPIARRYSERALFGVRYVPLTTPAKQCGYAEQKPP